MARAEKFRISHTRKVEGANRYLTEACEAGVIMNATRGANGRHVTVDGKRLLNFGSCSYLGLEGRPELREAAHDALEAYGTQFHFSRAFLECPLYVELESHLAAMTGRPVAVTASTTLGHMSALPVLIGESDTVLIDQFAHASLHTALQLVPSVPLEIVRHNRMDQLAEKLERLRGGKGLVWYVADGLYSMLGDFAPFEALKELLALYPNLRLYIDDAHATSWSGLHGRGSALDHFADDERVVVALSLNKSFSAAGGALAVPSEALKLRIRRAGGTMIFSGPIQPPMLGAAVGSARLHLGEELPQLQQELGQRIDRCLDAIARTELSVAVAERNPIFHVQCDSPRVVFSTATRMKELGFYCCICTFPAVPMNRPGIRFTISRHNSLEDVDAFVAALAVTIRGATEAATAQGSAALGPEELAEA
jgi:7-keto-8-aminopelargonate synthetase-like enzyme